MSSLVLGTVVEPRASTRSDSDEHVGSGCGVREPEDPAVIRSNVSVWFGTAKQQNLGTHVMKSQTAWEAMELTTFWTPAKKIPM